MEGKKNLKIEAVICDVHSVSEETLSAYDQVSISCVNLISSPEARALLGRYHAAIETVNTLDVEGAVRLSTVNGSMHLTPGQLPPAEKTMLLLNGSMDVAPGCEGVLDGYAAMMINGSVDVPESVAGRFTGANVILNGAVRAYPDGCIRLNRTTVLDRTFPLRARQDALYYAANRIIALAGDIDFGRLAEKNVRFATPKLLIAEGLAEAALPLFDEKTDIQILPDGCAYLDGDTTLDGNTVRRHGGKLYIDGDLTVLEDGPWLDQVTYLRVDGDVLAARGLAGRLDAMDMACDTLYLVGGTLLNGKSSVRVTRGMLENAEGGLSLVSCGSVTVEEDVPAELLREKLVSVIACGGVTCTEGQRDVIELAARDTGDVGPRKQEDEEEADDPNMVTVEAVYYTF